MNLLRITLGAISGVVATGPMTVAMTKLHRKLPDADRYPLPPREITMKLADESGLAEKLGPTARSAATFLAHFCYGAAAGALFGAGSKKPGPARGVLFGLFVWTVSYLGLLPRAGVLSSATDHPASRNALMIVAHVIWGLTLGYLLETFLHDSEDSAAFAASNRTHRDRA
jgi:hypothetical protein